MANLSDIIENYLKSLLTSSIEGEVNIKRNDLAEHFSCVPSQINYVLSTRFTIEQGYIVESRRGGGGFVRIIRVSISNDKNSEIINFIQQHIGAQIPYCSAHNFIVRLHENDILTQRETQMILAATDKDVLPSELGISNEIRANILKAMLISLLKLK
jgi:transcriptional regulator of stress and heat shock response